MKVVEAMEKVTRELDNKDELGIESIVAYGIDIHKDLSKAKDFNMLFVVNDIDLNVINTIHHHMKKASIKCLDSALIMERGELEGMMDSVPEIFLQILISFQTLYGNQPFVGLSSISHEHLRAQTERCIRESLCRARMSLMKGLNDKTIMLRSIKEIEEMMEISVKLYHILSRPWITEPNEHKEAFKEEFPGVTVWMDMLERNDMETLSHQILSSLAHNMIHEGIKPMLMKVDEMGP